jgi:hypothetical protein
MERLSARFIDTPADVVEVPAAAKRAPKARRRVATRA